MIGPLLIVLLAAELPDPGHPSFAGLIGVVGYFLGGLLARVRRVPAQDRSRWMGAGMWAGIGCGGAVWILCVAIDRL